MTDAKTADETDAEHTGDGGDAEVAPDELHALVERVPLGWTEVAYAGRTWGLTRADHAGGGTTTLYAEELGGTSAVSANVWRTSGGDVLRPCEMPAAVVVDFLRGWEPGA